MESKNIAETPFDCGKCRFSTGRVESVTGRTMPCKEVLKVLIKELDSLQLDKQSDTSGDSEIAARMALMDNGPLKEIGTTACNSYRNEYLSLVNDPMGPYK